MFCSSSNEKEEKKEKEVRLRAAVVGARDVERVGVLDVRVW